MFYTKLVISESVEESYRAFLSKRWEFVALTTSGGTKAKRYAPDSEWDFTPVHIFESYNSQESQEDWDQDAPQNNIFPDGTTYFEAVRGWESAAIAQDFVAAVQSLNLTGVTISYEGENDSTSV
jgi:hypothetical protein